MIGLADEYVASASTARRNDKKSIMNEGSKHRKRHYSHVLGGSRKALINGKAKSGRLDESLNILYTIT